MGKKNPIFAKNEIQFSNGDFQLVQSIQFIHFQSYVTASIESERKFSRFPDLEICGKEK